MTPKLKPLIHLPLDGDCPIVTDVQTSKEDKQEALRDYDTIRRSIEYLTDHWREQPSLERLSDHIGLSPHHLQRPVYPLDRRAFTQGLHSGCDLG